MKPKQKTGLGKSQSGFAHILLIIAAVIMLVILGFVGWDALNRNNAADQAADGSPSRAPTTTDGPPN